MKNKDKKSNLLIETDSVKNSKKSSKRPFKALKASLKYDLKFAEKLSKVCEYHGIDKSKVFRALVELEFTRIEKFQDLFNKKQKKS